LTRGGLGIPSFCSSAYVTRLSSLTTLVRRREVSVGLLQPERFAGRGDDNIAAHHLDGTAQRIFVGQNPRLESPPLYGPDAVAFSIRHLCNLALGNVFGNPTSLKIGKHHPPVRLFTRMTPRCATTGKNADHHQRQEEKTYSFHVLYVLKTRGRLQSLTSDVLRFNHPR